MVEDPSELYLGHSEDLARNPHSVGDRIEHAPVRGSASAARGA